MINNISKYVLLNGTSAQKVTNTVLGDTNAPSIVTAQYTDAYGRTIQASKTFEQVELTKTYEYDSLDRLLKETNENGHLHCRDSEVPYYESQYCVTSIAKAENGYADLRVLSETKPTETAEILSPTLEDYYLSVFGGSGI